VCPAGRADDGSWALVVDVRCLSGVSSFPHRTRLHVRRRDVGSGKAETGEKTKATHHSCRSTTGGALVNRVCAGGPPATWRVTRPNM
jgi:hypothetical protein